MNKYYAFLGLAAVDKYYLLQANMEKIFLGVKIKDLTIILI
jgi:hypothetical protein